MTNGKRRRYARRNGIRVSAGLAVIGLVAVLVPVVARAVTGNVSPSAIEIDASANLHPGGSTVKCSGVGASLPAGFDWVRDCAANTDPATVVDSVATGIIPGVSGRVGGFGHWNGVRVVDGVAGADQDIFLTGGKENDLSTWNVGPGSVGSSKYDLTQAYLANNQTDLFFGMERRGNNGSTAFDFEFNQAAPTGPYLPVRSVGDVLLTFEMQGAGNSGSAVPHYFVWDGSTYVESATPPAGTVTSINTDTTTPAPPWGFVDAKGNWTDGTFEKFGVAEAKVPLSALPGVNACGGNAYVQVRTRSAATATSDLKDTSKTFPFSFGSPTAKAQLSTGCTQQFTYGSAGSTGTDGGTTNLGYAWNISVSPATASLSGGGVSATSTPGSYTSTSAGGTVAVTLPAGVDSAAVTVNNRVSQGTCTASSDNKTVTVYRLLGATATLTPKCNNTFDFAGTASGGKSPYTYAWVFEKNSQADGNGTWSTYGGGSFTNGSATSASGTFAAGSAGAYRAKLTVKDSADGASSDPDVTVKGQCTATATSNAINVFDAVGGTVGLTPDCDSTFGYAAAGSGGKAPYTYAFTLEKQVNGSWVSAKTFTASDTLSAPGVSGTLDANDASVSPGGEGRYRLRVTITDSQGLVCSTNLTSNEIDVRNALTASAAKTSADGSALTVLLTGSTDSGGNASGASVQWQRETSPGVWANIAGQTAATLTYSSFETDDTVTDAADFVMGGDPYKGKIWAVNLRLHASRTLNGILCEDVSDAVTVKKVTAVDP